MNLPPRFAELSERVDDLHFRFVPPLEPTGIYTAAEYDRMSAFRLLVHAEIERFIELLVEDALSRFLAKLESWKKIGCNSLLVNSLISHMEKELRKEVRSNHGVKSKNILALLKPLGLSGTHLDNFWLQTMDAYGEIRGRHAHNSRRTTQPIDPRTEQDLIYMQILPALMRLELLVANVL
jgi:hypothetical protein